MGAKRNPGILACLPLVAAVAAAVASPAWAQRQVESPAKVIEAVDTDRELKGVDFPDPTRIVFELGGGMNWTADAQRLLNSGQTITGDPAWIGRFSVGVLVPDRIGLVDLGANLVVQGQQTSPRRLLNSGGGGTLPLSGTSGAWSVYPELAAIGPLIGRIDWRLGLGAGLAFQRIDVSSGGVPVLTGSATTAMVNFRGGLSVPLTSNVRVGVDGNVTWFAGYKAGSGGSSISLTDRIEAAIFAFVRVDDFHLAWAPKVSPF